MLYTNTTTLDCFVKYFNLKLLKKLLLISNIVHLLSTQTTQEISSYKNII